MKKALHAFLFPGQGIRQPQISPTLIKRYPVLGTMLVEIDQQQIFSFSCQDLVTNPAEIQKTNDLHIQIAVFLVSALHDWVLKKEGMTPEVTFGYSSGVYSAVYSAGAVSLSESLVIVKQAYDLMRKQVAQREVGMVVITGLREDVVREIMAQVQSFGSLSMANINSKRQFFLSGDRLSLEKAMTLAHQPGLLNARWLPVSIPYHSQLIEPALAEFKKVIEHIHVTGPQIPVIAGYDGSLVRTKDRIKELLVQQLVETVNFPHCLNTLLELKITHYWEVGSGEFLKKLLRHEPRVSSIIQTDRWINDLVQDNPEQAKPHP